MRYPSAYFEPAGVWRACARVLCCSIILCCFACVVPAQAAAEADTSPAVPATSSPDAAPADAPAIPAPEENPWLPVGPPVPPELQFEPAPEPQPQIADPPPARRRPQRVLLVGDSLMQNGCLGSQLEARFKQYPGLHVARWAKQSTGLSRKDYFDWSAKLQELIDKYQPDLIVAIWGANDCQSVTNCARQSAGRLWHRGLG